MSQLAMSDSTAVRITQFVAQTVNSHLDRRGNDFMALNDAALGRRAAEVLSVATFRHVIRDEPVDRAEMLLRSFAHEGMISLKDRRVDALTVLADFLKRKYRNEHVYKAAITEKIFIGRHGIYNASIMNEFAVASSVIDTVIVNGSATAYEIKTELDSATKLRKQLLDYSRAFRRTFVVTHESLEHEYRNRLRDTSAGLIVLTRRGTLSKRIEATSDTRNLAIETMMKCLRKAEYTNLIDSYYGTSFSVQSVQHFKYYLEMSDRIDPVAFNKLFEQQLRQRTLRNPDLLKETSNSSLKQFYVQLNPNLSQHSKLNHWLRERV
ncbi:sce7726 family protein [Rhodococcus cerastii]|uniref:Sce7726 family protein n=1 Tax=Rhodococcus erythropolis TaxID=1833 RepID=A0AAX3ZY91_RHOER|nr:sce7726 family protein [Rhodococcus erythropolis]MCD2156856.1 sce7726 family protein [Rhodococcus cerastii]WMN01763.1 sce7726 family protein [Rhodococcus erythropolis]